MNDTSFHIELDGFDCWYLDVRRYNIEMSYDIINSDWRVCTVINFISTINLQVIDMLLFKGMEELNNVVEHAKQRHHIVGQYVVGPQGLVQDLGTKDKGLSDFLKNFYNGNYF
ncbi:NADH dehydrogenase [ubiquinone] 1 alpha subcomplex subunit 6 [Morella rubra]|uniref:NADH dehydrogenase [ubiquinone] 1 alpha subcomplex subunit 6 n=1 Tax=Morella rubra TaxID=262757 RepID=A0A6A1WI32_9ROSI|nr:NADH dehydrogenase [ubiquinone] 1 alpha subcomplex subunit 6 [Morella rubra]